MLWQSCAGVLHGTAGTGSSLEVGTKCMHARCRRDGLPGRPRGLDRQVHVQWRHLSSQPGTLMARMPLPLFVM